MALVVAAIVRSARVPLPAVISIGLAFEVVGSYGIAAAEFADPSGPDQRGRLLGLSWVAVWTVLFTVVVPTPPPRALVAALASVSSVPAGGTAETRENAVQGTPAFIAPEQVLGNAVDGRADICATGCVAYWLLTGQLVFTAETPMGLLLQHARTPPVPPSTRTGLPIPAALDRLVLSCLAKDPAQRPQSARELSLRLAEVEGAGSWTQDRAREWWATYQPAEPEPSRLPASSAPLSSRS